MTDTDVLVVGASAAGLGVVECLRRGGFAGQITAVGAERHVPYDRPPLSKQVLSGDWSADKANLRNPEQLEELKADFHLGETATSLNLGNRTVTTSTGRQLRAEHVVIATGTSARTLRGQPDLDGVHTLRTVEDALAIRADLLRADRVVVVGEGVLGSEIAATATKLGVDVTMTGPQSSPMLAQLGPVVSDVLGGRHQEAGVALRLGRGVTGLTGENGRVRGVVLDDGAHLDADAVIVAIGARPETDWLAGSGLLVDDGVVCDAYCQAAPGIYAVGDVARWRHPAVGRPIRLENRTNAIEQSAAVAEAILGRRAPYAPTPYFWTDQYDARIQVHGVVTPDAEVEIVDGDLAERRFVARYRAGDVITAVVGWNMPKQSRLRRQEITAFATNEGVTVG